MADTIVRQIELSVQTVLRRRLPLRALVAETFPCTIRLQRIHAALMREQLTCFNHSEQ